MVGCQKLILVEKHGLESFCDGGWLAYARARQLSTHFQINWDELGPFWARDWAGLGKWTSTCVAQTPKMSKDVRSCCAWKGSAVVLFEMLFELIVRLDVYFAASSLDGLRWLDYEEA